MPRPFLFLLIVLAGCTPQPAPIRATPAIWLVRDADTRILLLGTVHVLPDHVDWQHGRVEQTIDAADELVLEIADIADGQAQAARFLKWSRVQGQPPIADRVPQAARADLIRIAGDTGPALPVLDRMKTWAAAVALGGGLLRHASATRENGVDQVLARRFAAAGKPVTGLETADDQFALFDSLEEAHQRRLLTRTVADGRDPAARFAAMLSAWASGNDDAITAAFDGGMPAGSALSVVLIERRNAAWAERIAARLERPGTVLVAVGAGHLAGPRSVQAMLRARGMRVARLQ